METYKIILSMFSFKLTSEICFVSRVLLLVFSKVLTTLPVVEVPPWPVGSGFSRATLISSSTHF